MCKGKCGLSISVSGLPVPPLPLDVATDYYLSRGVGLVEVEIRQDGVPQLLSKLWSHRL
jgi:hypothetical protein